MLWRCVLSISRRRWGGHGRTVRKHSVNGNHSVPEQRMAGPGPLVNTVSRLSMGGQAPGQHPTGFSREPHDSNRPRGEPNPTSLPVKTTPSSNTESAASATHERSARRSSKPHRGLHQAPVFQLEHSRQCQRQRQGIFPDRL